MDGMVARDLDSCLMSCFVILFYFILLFINLFYPFVYLIHPSNLSTHYTEAELAS